MDIAIYFMMSLLAPGLPPVCLEELDNFPDRQVVIAWRKFNLDSLAYFRRKYEFSCDTRSKDAEELRQTIIELEEDYEIWNELDNAQVYADPHLKLRSLATLRALIGSERYYSGSMPPPVPLWRWHY